MEKTAPCYSAQPKTALVLKGGKGYKDRVTFLLCCGADGNEKLLPLIVGKLEKSCCLEGLSHYPCEYRSSKNAWMTGRCLESGWALSRGKLPARPGMCFG